MAVPQAEMYSRVSAWQIDGWSPAAVWHWTPDWRARAPFACGAPSGGQQHWGVVDARAVCPQCLAASAPR